MEKLIELFRNLKGAHLVKDSEDEKKMPENCGIKGIDCCDSDAGSCNSGACV